MAPWLRLKCLYCHGRHYKKGTKGSGKRTYEIGYLRPEDWPADSVSKVGTVDAAFTMAIRNERVKRSPASPRSSAMTVLWKPRLIVEVITELVTGIARVMLELRRVEAKWWCSTARKQEITMIKGKNHRGVAAKGAWPVQSCGDPHQHWVCAGRGLAVGSKLSEYPRGTSWTGTAVPAGYPRSGPGPSGLQFPCPPLRALWVLTLHESTRCLKTFA